MGQTRIMISLHRGPFWAEKLLLDLPEICRLPIYAPAWYGLQLDGLATRVFSVLYKVNIRVRNVACFIFLQRPTYHV